MNVWELGCMYVRIVSINKIDFMLPRKLDG
jgi:hypothetical protein